MGSTPWRGWKLDRVGVIPGLLLALLSALGCAVRTDSTLRWASRGAPTGEASGRATWTNLERLAPGTPVLVLDRSGRFQAGPWVGASENDLATRGFRKSREEVAAVAVIPEDSNWSGVAVGAGAGGILGLLGASTDEDMSAAFWGLVGLGAGALAGALIDEGVRDAERLVYAAGQPEVEPRRWRIEVARQDLGAWLQDRRVHLMLRDGSYIDADVEGAQGSNLMVKVREVEGPFAGRGTNGIPLEEIASVIYRERTRGSVPAAAVGGAVGGSLAGAWVAGLVGDVSGDESRALGGGIAGGVIGILGSWAAVERYGTREVVITPVDSRSAGGR